MRRLQSLALATHAETGRSANRVPGKHSTPGARQALDAGRPAMDAGKQAEYPERSERRAPGEPLAGAENAAVDAHISLHEARNDELAKYQSTRCRYTRWRRKKGMTANRT